MKSSSQFPLATSEHDAFGQDGSIIKHATDCASNVLDCACNQQSSCIKGRFAPSPTGRMHAGNIFAYLAAWLIAKAQGGTIVLRIEDLDRERSKPEYIDSVLCDFEMLGLTWDEGPYFQSTRSEIYQETFEVLSKQGLVYPCYCSRADLHAASAPHKGEKPIYQGTCRKLTTEERLMREKTKPPAWRLIVPDETISLFDMIQGPYAQNLIHECGDFLIKRSDGAFAYQLAVVVDDAEQGISSVVRGVDLLSSTPQQLYLGSQIGAQVATYAHVPLLVDQEGRRLSKRNKDASLEELLNAYRDPAGVIGHIAYLVGLQPEDQPIMPQDLLKCFSLDQISQWKNVSQIQWK